jgi:hypothetical protein
MGEGEWAALRRVLNDNNQWLPDVCRMLAVFFKWTEVFQSIGVHAGLARQAVREYLAACDPTKQHTPEAREVAAALQTLVVEYFATCMDFTPAATAAELDRFSGHRLTAIAEILDPRGWALRLKAISESRDKVKLQRLLHAYVFGLSGSGGLFAKIIKEYTPDKLGVEEFVAAGGWGAAAGVDELGFEAVLKRELVAWLVGVSPGGEFVEWSKFTGAEFIAAICAPAYRARFPNLAVLQVR